MRLRFLYGSIGLAFCISNITNAAASGGGDERKQAEHHAQIIRLQKAYDKGHDNTQRKTHIPGRSKSAVILGTQQEDDTTGVRGLDSDKEDKEGGALKNGATAVMSKRLVSQCITATHQEEGSKSEESKGIFSRLRKTVARAWHKLTIDDDMLFAEFVTALPALLRKNIGEWVGRDTIFNTDELRLKMRYHCPPHDFKPKNGYEAFFKKDRITYICISKNNKIILIGTNDGMVHVVDIHRGMPIKAINCRKDRDNHFIRQISINPVGDAISVDLGAYCRRFETYAMSTGEQIDTPPEMVTQIDTWKPHDVNNGYRISFGDPYQDPRLMFVIRRISGVISRAFIFSHCSKEVKYLADFSPDGTLLALASCDLGDPIVEIWGPRPTLPDCLYPSDEECREYKKVLDPAADEEEDQKEAGENTEELGRRRLHQSTSAVIGGYLTRARNTLNFPEEMQLALENIVTALTAENADYAELLAKTKQVFQEGQQIALAITEDAAAQARAVEQMSLAASLGGMGV